MEKKILYIFKVFFTCFRRRQLTISLLTQTYFTKFTKAGRGGGVFYSFSGEDVNAGTIRSPGRGREAKLRKHSVNSAYGSAVSKGSNGERDGAELGGGICLSKEVQQPPGASPTEPRVNTTPE